MPRKSKDELKIINDEILEATKNSGKSKTSTNSIKKRNRLLKNQIALLQKNQVQKIMVQMLLLKKMQIILKRNQRLLRKKTLQPIK